MKLGEIIKTYRFEHKLSLREFANQCGVSFAQINIVVKPEELLLFTTIQKGICVVVNKKGFK